MKKLLLVLGTAIALFATASCGRNSNNNNNDMDMTQIPEEPVVKLETSLGTIRIKLYSKTPKHRDNFVKLVREGYYDSLRFHRVINGFMIQCGDPFSKDTSKIDLWGQGGPDYTIPAEFVNEYYHKKGAIAAARKGDMANPKKASSGSQFYLVHDEMGCLHLDGAYTVFGETIEGLDVIDRIAAVPTDRYDRPCEDVLILKASLELPEPESKTEAEPETESEPEAEK